MCQSRKGPARAAATPKRSRQPRLWQHAERLHPKRPWKIVAEEFDLNPAQTLDCYRSKILPPGMGVDAVELFLSLPAS
jgi:hypothetical protein